MPTDIEKTMSSRNIIQYDDHGCFAKVGDVVEVVDDKGNKTGVFGIVTEIIFHGAEIMDDRRYLRLATERGVYHDGLVRIISHASER